MHDLPAEKDTPQSAAEAGTTQLMGLLLAAEGLEEFLEGLAERAAGAAGIPLSCGVTVQPGESGPVTAGNDPRAVGLDEEQYAAGEGPGLDALRFRDTQHLLDTADADADRWQHFRGRALAHGVRSALSLPLIVPGDVRPAGSLTLYAPRAAAFDTQARERVEIFARQAAVALGVSRKIADLVETTEDLHAALASRPVIDQALGIIMAQRRCDSEVAFTVLRRASQRQNDKLLTVARRFIEHITGKPPVVRPFRPRR
ncbi:hypothetical protein GCM10009716_08330 [Streptomyces sodiiphilus]|uniref:ANTAR domain-containing protein n=1 Tax=Streptomyces sodiiphilus TaxID=226217 RepID=A0ABN2NSA1_9ACTN